MTVQEVFARIPQKVQENAEAFQGVKGTFRFVIRMDAGEAVYCVTLPEGRVVEGCGEGDVTVQLGEKDFLRLLSGELNPVTAYMMGKIRVSGRMDLAMQLAGILKALA